MIRTENQEKEWHNNEIGYLLLNYLRNNFEKFVVPKKIINIFSPLKEELWQLACTVNLQLGYNEKDLPSWDARIANPHEFWIEVADVFKKAVEVTAHLENLYKDKLIAYYFLDKMAQALFHGKGYSSWKLNEQTKQLFFTEVKEESQRYQRRRALYNTKKLRDVPQWKNAQSIEVDGNYCLQLADQLSQHALQFRPEKSIEKGFFAENDYVQEINHLDISELTEDQIYEEMMNIGRKAIDEFLKDPKKKSEIKDLVKAIDKLEKAFTGKNIKIISHSIGRLLYQAHHSAPEDKEAIAKRLVYRFVNDCQSSFVQSRKKDDEKGIVLDCQSNAKQMIKALLASKPFDASVWHSRSIKSELNGAFGTAEYYYIRETHDYFKLDNEQLLNEIYNPQSDIIKITQELIRRASKNCLQRDLFKQLIQRCTPMYCSELYIDLVISEALEHAQAHNPDKEWIEDIIGENISDECLTSKSLETKTNFYQ